MDKPQGRKPVVLGVLVAFVLVAAAALWVTLRGGSPGDSKEASARAQLSELSRALVEYKRICNYFPTTDQSLLALVSKPHYGTPCLSYPPAGFIRQVPTDPWGRPFIYQSNGKRFELRSLGSGGAPGGAGGGELRLEGP